MSSTRTTASVIADLDTRLSDSAALDTASVRRIRRDLSRELKASPATIVQAIALALTERDGPFDRFIAVELVAAHPQAMQTIDTSDIRRLGRGMDSWDDVDVFACILAGPAWRNGCVSDAEVRRWARSRDRWWRRAAVVSTVALNNRARGGSGDPARTLMICRLALGDRDPMVVKALSWSLRELVKRDAGAVRKFLDEHGVEVPALVRREVGNKLRTGRKAPTRSRPRSAAR